jgi:L-lactate dehydrogenase
MKIGIVGAGQVGATAAYSMMMRRVGSEIVLVDRKADLAVAQARDNSGRYAFCRSGPRPRGRVC